MLSSLLQLTNTGLKCAHHSFSGKACVRGVGRCLGYGHGSKPMVNIPKVYSVFRIHRFPLSIIEMDPNKLLTLASPFFTQKPSQVGDFTSKQLLTWWWLQQLSLRWASNSYLRPQQKRMDSTLRPCAFSTCRSNPAESSLLGLPGLGLRKTVYWYINYSWY